MSPGVWQLLALALIATCIAGLVVYAARLDGRGSHTIRSVRLRAADPFASEDDRRDPYGEHWPPRPADDGPDLDALERPGPIGTGWFPVLDEPADITGVNPECKVRPEDYLDGKSTDEFVGELFGKPAEVTP